MPPTKVFVIASQRSGTNALRSAMQASERFFDCNEILHPLSIEGEFSQWSFWKYRNDNFGDMSPDIPDTNFQTQVWNAYSEYLDTKAKDIQKTAIVDLKINSLHNLNGAWADPCWVPHLLSLLASNRERIIYLKRSNLLEMFASNHLASLSNQWVIPSEDGIIGNQKEIPDGLILPVKELIGYIKIKEMESQLVDFWMHETSSMGASIEEILFENMFSSTGNSLSTDSENKILELSGIENSADLKFPITTSKTTPQLHKIFSNFSNEVVEELIRTGYKKYIPEYL